MIETGPSRDLRTLPNSETPSPDQVRAAVARDFAASELFDRTFGEGMALVEDAAAYLDGAGRQDSKSLSRDAALAYAAESMKLTTRLMQVASWLLVQRAVREGDMAPLDACQDRYRLSEAGRPAAEPERVGEVLPPGLGDLTQRAERLHGLVLHLDRRIYVEAPAAPEHHPVRAQHDRLQAAFGS